MKTNRKTHPAGKRRPSAKFDQLRREHAQVLDRLQKTHAEVNHFVRALSHDMSVNLILLQTSFQELKKSLQKALPSSVEPDVALVEACLRQSRRYLDDLVELGKTGSVQVQPSRVELSTVIDEVLFEQRPLLDQRQVEVVVQSPLPAVWCNTDRVKQIVVNLLRNAVKHGCDSQRPRIVISAVVDSATEETVLPNRVALRIHDNGPGIPRRYHQEIFLPGRRAPGCAADGSGMGLAIVKKIADLYGGDAYVDPSEVPGTTMVVCLPYAQSAQRTDPCQDGPSGPRAQAHPAGHGLHPHHSRTLPGNSSYKS
jgi:signal transduction histidine kinase